MRFLGMPATDNQSDKNGGKNGHGHAQGMTGGAGPVAHPISGASQPHHKPPCTAATNLGVHLANRLVEVGCTTAFAVPGDFNLLLLDQLLKHPDLELVWCCNELNAGYAADGYARAKGIGCVVVTFTVGGLSVLNAVAGSMSEDVPVLVICGAPNSNDYSANRVLHHTTGYPDFQQQLRAFKEVTCYAQTITHIDEASRLVDEALSKVLMLRKPALLEVSCNLADLSHPSFTRPPVPFALPPRHTNKASLEAAVEAALEVLDKSEKPLLLAGPRIREGSARSAFMHLVSASQYGYAWLPDAKGLVPEEHDQAMGLYWGAVSWPGVCEAVEAASHVITCGAVWTDYSSVGYSLLLQRNKTIRVADGRITIGGGLTFGCIAMEDFLEALAERVKPNHASIKIFKRMQDQPLSAPPPQPTDAPLIATMMVKQLQSFLKPEYVIISEVGDSWFNSQKLRLPNGAAYEIQLRYGSIGWSVGAVLGYAAALRRRDEPNGGNAGAGEAAGAIRVSPNGSVAEAVPDSSSRGSAGPQNKRVLALIGDGSFQMTAQEVSTILRSGLNPIILLINNGAYSIEVEIHDGPYNKLQNWNYTAFVEAMHNGQGKLWTAKARTEQQLVDALSAATSEEHKQDCCFIEVLLDRDDVSKELLEWGSRVAAANSRAPGPAH